MCGIWGYIRFLTGNDKEANVIYNAYMDVQKRGPDRSDFKEINEFVKIYLGFHRLAIMDRSTYGDQPFTLEIYENDGEQDCHRSIYATCNGEIYNYKQLLHQYPQIKKEMRSGSDCEFLPHLYAAVGFRKMIEQLRGEFAICIIDINHTYGYINMYIGRDQSAVRPIFIGHDQSGIAFSSTLGGIVNIIEPDHIRQLKRAEIMAIHLIKNGQVKVKYQQYHILNADFVDGRFLPLRNELGTSHTIKTTYAEIPKRLLPIIRDKFEEAVNIRLESDRPLGALLSGGLDSSLDVSISAARLSKQGKRLRTFSIGIPGSTDKQYAEMVAKHCDTDHTHVEFTEADFLNAIENVVYTIGTYDITTVRASVGQYLICKWIHDNTDIRVLLIGDGSDELCSGYMYFHNAPSPLAAHLENIDLLTNIPFFDVLRADSCIGGNGIEGRVAFLDHEFVDLWLSIPHAYRIPTTDKADGKKIEKWLLRKSFDCDHEVYTSNGDKKIQAYLPDEVLWRKKEAFSDGVSSTTRSWYQIIQENLESKYTDDDLCDPEVQYHLAPPTKEALHYRLLFNKYFHPLAAGVVPNRYWMPKWSGDAKDPSARTLQIYKEQAV